MKAVDHRKQVICGLLLVRQDERPHSVPVRHPPVVAALDIGADTRLPCLQDQCSYPPGLLALPLQLIMDGVLYRIQLEWEDAALLGSDPQTGLSVKREVSLELGADIFRSGLKIDHVAPLPVASPTPHA